MTPTTIIVKSLVGAAILPDTPAPTSPFKVTLQKALPTKVVPKLSYVIKYKRFPSK